MGCLSAKQKQMSFDVVSFPSMNPKAGNTWETRFCLTGVVSEVKACGDTVDTSTMDKIWKILLWSFGCLAKGVWPFSDWDNNVFSETYRPEVASRAGQQLCGCYKFVV